MASPELAIFDRDLTAAVLAGVPIEVGDADSAAAAVRLTPKTADLLTESSRQLGGRDITVPARYVVASKVFRHIHHSEPILDALSARALATAQAIRVMRWSIVYVILIAIVALLGLLFFATQLAPLIAETRMDLEVRTIPGLELEPQGQSLVQPIAITVALLLAALLIGTVCGGMRRVAMWLGGAAFVRSRVAAAAARVSQLLQRAGVAQAEANVMALELAGADASMQRILLDAMPGILSDEAGVQNEFATGYFLTSGNRCLARMKAVAPALLVLIIGGSVAMAYGAAIFLPVIDLLRDLSQSGVR